MEAQSKPTASRELMVVGFFILLVGVAALASELYPQVDRYLPLAIGLGLFVLFAVSRAYVALIFGGILTGIGVGLLAAQVFALSGQSEGGVTVLGLGLGFGSIWLISLIAGLRERHWWPLIPGTILCVVGISLITSSLTERLVAPVALIAVGAVVILIALLRWRATSAAR